MLYCKQKRISMPHLPIPNLFGYRQVRQTIIFKSYAKEMFVMKYTYRTKGTCSSQIELELDGDVVHNVKFTGGCDGNLKAIPQLVEGMTVDEVEKRIGGIRCGFKNTSCGDQLAKACRLALQENA